MLDVGTTVIVARKKEEEQTNATSIYSSQPFILGL